MSIYNRNTVLEIKLNGGQNHSRLSVSNAIVSYVIVAIAKHPMCQAKIRKEYEQDRRRYEEINKNNKYAFTHVFDSFPAVESHHMNKLSQMYNAQPDNNKDEFLIGYIKHGYNRVIQYVERHPVLNIGQFADFHQSRESTHLSEAKHHYMTALLIFVSWKYGKLIANQSSKENAVLIENIATNLISNESSTKKSLELDDVGKKRAMNAFQSAFGAKVKKEQAIDHIIYKLEEKALNQLTKDEKKKYLSGEDVSVLYKQDNYKHFKNFTSLVRLYGLNDINYLDNVHLKNEEYYNIYSIFEYLVKQERIDKNDFPMFMSAALVIHTLVSHYKNLRKAYFEQEEELNNNRAVAIENKEDSLELERNKNAFEKEKQTLQERITFLEKELKEAQRREEKLLKQQEKELLNKQEVMEENEELKKALFIEEEPLEESEVTQEEDIIEKVKNLKLAVVGGHSKYHTKLKEEFPGIRFVGPDEKTVDLSFLSSMDAVVFVTSYNNHIQFYRTKSALRHTKVPLVMMVEQASPLLFSNNLVNSIPE